MQLMLCHWCYSCYSDATHVVTRATLVTLMPLVLCHSCYVTRVMSLVSLCIYSKWPPLTDKLVSVNVDILNSVATATPLKFAGLYYQDMTALQSSTYCSVAELLPCIVMIY